MSSNYYKISGKVMRDRIQQLVAQPMQPEQAMIIFNMLQTDETVDAFLDYYFTVRDRTKEDEAAIDDTIRAHERIDRLEETIKQVNALDTDHRADLEQRVYVAESIYGGLRKLAVLSSLLSLLAILTALFGVYLGVTT